MITKEQVTGVVLAGGRSSRFGSNKALLSLNEKTLLQKALNVLHPYCKEVLISGDYPEYGAFNNVMLPDEISELGPLGGIYTSLKYTSTPYVLFLACDMPLVNGKLLEKMLRDDSPEMIKVWYQIDGSIHLYPALFSIGMLPIVEQQIEKKEYAVRKLLFRVIPKMITVNFLEERAFFDVNETDDFRQLKKMM